jgi:hypothetical protein
LSHPRQHYYFSKVALAEAGSNRLNNGESLKSNEFLASSNGLYKLFLQADGNLVVKKPVKIQLIGLQELAVPMRINS